MADQVTMVAQALKATMSGTEEVRIDMPYEELGCDG